MSQTDTGTADKAYYDAESHYFSDPNFMAGHRAIIEAYVSKYRPLLADLARRRGRNLSILELGAGTCTLSLTLSKEPWVGSMRCVDISAQRMNLLAQTVSQHVGGRLELLSFADADFSEAMSYDDGSFDVILFDASLHHSRNIWLTLRECHRMLSPDGLLIAQREQYAAPLTYRRAFNRLLRSPEVSAGVAENSYLKEQYDYYLRATGFRPRFLPVAHGRLSAISFLNGLVFSKWVIVAERRPAAPVLD